MNPPWQRNAGQINQLGLQNQINQLGQIQSQLNQLGLQNQIQYQNVPFTQFGGTNANQILQAPPAPPFSAVSYPHQNSRNQSGGSVNSQSQSSNYNSMGTVTKVHNDCGFVDDEVFFHKNVCKGTIPKIGDKVLVEATFNANSPFKWNATRIQIIPTTGSASRNQPPPLMGTSIPNIKGGSVPGSVYNAVPPPNEYGRNLTQGQRRHTPPPPRISPERHSRYRDDDENDRKRRREERERDRERERERERERDRERNRERDKRDHSSERRERERSPIRRGISPKRRRTRAIPRYLVQIPKISLFIREADVLELRRRYINLYIPSDFFHTQIKWSEAFTPDKPLSIHRPCSFHVMHKTVNTPKDFSAPAEPSDANYLFSAKVMLMGAPPISEFYEKCLSNEKERDNRDYIHPSRLINFLIGVKGKNEMMAIGGPWSPSLDGMNPESDPTVLIKTAIRTCKALTGIDLSACTQWYRFVELYYRRPETVQKGQVIPARVETVVIFLPDINSCVPTRIEWDNLHIIYKQGLERALNPVADNNPSEDNNSSHNSTDGVGGGCNNKEIQQLKTSGLDGCENEVNQEEGPHDEGVDKNKKEPTHFSKLDTKTMKIQELRDELEARNLSSKGLKPQLIARLVKVLNAEKAEEDNTEANKSEQVGENEDTQQSVDIDQGGDDNIENMDMNDMVILDEYDSTKNHDSSPVKKDTSKVLDEKEKRQLERRYQLPENPHIIVHPSKTAKSGKFDCITTSLSVLLDYRPEDTKERSFEVSLFAELFNEMLMRDFGFNIYKEIARIPEKSKDKDDNSVVKKEDGQKSNNSNENKSKKDEEDKNEKSARGSGEIKINDHDSKSVSSSNSDKKSGKDREKDKEKDKSDKEKDKSDKEKDKCDKVSKRPHTEDESEGDDYSVKSGDKRRKRNMIIAKHDLLLSFVYFDTTHCGYIFEKDIEDLFYILGLNLSRNQVRKLLSKVISRDALYYRKLTDKKDEDDTNTSTQNVNEPASLIDVSELAKGNKILLPKFGVSLQEEKNMPKKRKLDNENELESNTSSNQTMVFYNGGLIDISKLIDKMNRSDKAREDIEKLLTDLRRQNSDLQSSNIKFNNRIKDLQSETKSLNRKLFDTEQSLSSINRKYNEYYSIISSVYDKVSPIIKSERNYKSDRDRDRDRERDRDRNEKDKEKFEEKDRSSDNRNEKEDRDKKKENIEKEKSKEGKDENKNKDISNKDNDSNDKNKSCEKQNQNSKDTSASVGTKTSVEAKMEKEEKC